MPLTRVDRDEHMMSWFASLSVKVEGLDFDRPMLAGRTIQAMTKALVDCETFDAIATRYVLCSVRFPRSFLTVRSCLWQHSVFTTPLICSLLVYTRSCCATAKLMC